MKKTGNNHSEPDRRDTAVARQGNDDLHRVAEAGRLRAAGRRAARNRLPLSSDFLSTSDPLPLPHHTTPARLAVRKAASEPPAPHHSANQSNSSTVTAQTSTKEDHLELPSDEANLDTEHSVYHEYEPADFSGEAESYTSASDEPDLMELPEHVTVQSEDSGDLADSESSDAEPQRRAWFCLRRACRRLNPARLPLCQRCGASRLPTEAESAGRAASPAAGPSASPAGRDMCLVCGTRPADHALLHGGSACRAACRRCARRLRRRRQPCPSCRRPIQQVITMCQV